MNFFDLDDRVTAAALAAAGSVIGALIQLRIAWRKEVSERARGVPVTKKARRGPVLAVFVLLAAAAVGGFALSQYLAQRSDRESAAMRGELQTQLAQLRNTADRLERAAHLDHGTRASVDDARHGAQSVTATTMLGPCRARGGAGGDAAAACTEQEALRVTLCVSVPLSAAVTDMGLYARTEDSARPWTESRAAPGQELGAVRFAEQPFERAESDQTKLVCTGFSSWDGQHAYSARLVVKYAPSPAEHEASQVVVAPVSERAQ
jgi:hypothetical protein